MRILVLVVCLAASGCGSSRPQPPPSVAAPEDPPPAPTPPPPSRPSFDPSDEAKLAEIYRRAAKGDNSVWAEHGLTDDRGIPDPKAMNRYYQAVQERSKDPARWKAFQERVMKEQP